MVRATKEIDFTNIPCFKRAFGKLSKEDKKASMYVAQSIIFAIGVIISFAPRIS